MNNKDTYCAFDEKKIEGLFATITTIEIGMETEDDSVSMETDDDSVSMKTADEGKDIDVECYI